MRYASLFAGIGCAEVALMPLGWEPVVFSEIDPFASAVLAHRFPDVPNVGDIAAHDWSKYRGRIDLVIGGSPCQAFSVAGQRQSLADKRGNLALTFVEVCNAIDPAFVIWENVPGVQSCTRDNAFGCFLAGMVGASEPLRSGHRTGRWPDAGLVVGPQRAAAFGILDAQHFGVPQRRKRIFLLAVALSHPAFPPGKTPNPAEVLFNRESVFGNYPARGKARKKAVAVAGTGVTAGNDRQLDMKPGGSPIPQDVAHCLSTRFARNNETQETMIVHRDPPDVVPAVTAKWAKSCGGPAGDECQNLVAIPILEVGKRTGPSNDDRKAGCGIGNIGDPMFSLQARAQHGVACDEVAGTVTARLGTGGPDDNDAQRGMLISFHPIQDPIESQGCTHALGCGPSSGQASIAVAFTSKNYGADEGEVAPTLRAMGHSDSHMNGGGQIAVAAVTGEVAHTLSAEGADASEDGTGRGTPVVAVAMRGRAGGIHAEESPDLAFALRSGQGGADKAYVATRLTVRRLTPRECERLQGLPDDWTLIPYGRRKSCKGLAEFAAYLGVAPEVAKTLSADSLRYKACGNGMATPVVWWIGRRIEWVLQRLADETPGWHWRGTAWESL